MKTKDLAAIGFIAILIILLAYLWFAPAGQPIAPAVQFTDLDNKKFTLAELKGKPVIINFWATECPGCVKEIPLLIEMYHKYKSQNLVIIGAAMSYDPESQVREMVRQKSMDYPIVLDSNDDLLKAFNIKVTPTTIFIDAQGRIVQRKLGEMSHEYFQQSIQLIVKEE